MTESVLITGSSRGIGKAIALRLAKEKKYDIVLHCKQQREAADSLAEEIKEMGCNARVLQFDISDRSKTADILLADIEANGCYYGVVCNAGINRDNAFPAMPPEDWDNVIRTNLDGFYNVLNPLIMPMVHRRKPGRIVVMTSVSGIIGNRGQVNYSAAKAGLIGAAKSLAIELARRDITVNCVAPGLIETDMTSDLAIPKEEIMKIVPARRIGKSEEVAAAVNFLLSEEASYVTRQVISVNGGLT